MEALLLKRGVFFTLFFLNALALSLWASACGPDQGEWGEFKKSPTDFEFTGLDQLGFGKARIHSGPRGVIHHEPIQDFLNPTYDVISSRSKGKWTFKFMDHKEEAGSISLHMPKDWEFFQAETDQVLAGSDSSELNMYKEVRMEGVFHAAGLFAMEVSPKSRYRLILQGTGGRCFEPKDFKRWILQIEGPDPENHSQNTLYYWYQGSLTTS